MEKAKEGENANRDGIEIKLWKISVKEMWNGMRNILVCQLLMGTRRGQTN